MMADESVQPGRLVGSVKGRDRGRFYLVIGPADSLFVLVVDGEGRKVDNPKRKNVRHLQFYDSLAGEVAVKVGAGKRVTNMDVRKAIKSLVEALQN